MYFNTPKFSVKIEEKTSSIRISTEVVIWFKFDNDLYIHIYIGSHLIKNYQIKSWTISNKVLSCTLKVKLVHRAAVRRNLENIWGIESSNNVVNGLDQEQKEFFDFLAT